MHRKDMKSNYHAILGVEEIEVDIKNPSIRKIENRNNNEEYEVCTQILLT